MQDGKDVTLIATSNMLETAVKTAAHLKEKEISVRLLSMHTIKPIDREALTEAAAETKLIVTLEEHSSIGGLGSAVAEVLANNDHRPRHILLSAPDAFAKTTGSQSFFRTASGLTPEAITKHILSCLL
jgi:transketolase